MEKWKKFHTYLNTHTQWTIQTRTCVCVIIDFFHIFPFSISTTHQHITFTAYYGTNTHTQQDNKKKFLGSASKRLCVCVFVCTHTRNSIKSKTSKLFRFLQKVVRHQNPRSKSFPLVSYSAILLSQNRKKEHFWHDHMADRFSLCDACKKHKFSCIFTCFSSLI